MIQQVSACPTNKRRFATAIEADATARDLAARGKFDPRRGIPNPYWCGECHAWHLGDRRPNDPQPAPAGSVDRDSRPVDLGAVRADDLDTTESCRRCIGWIDEAEREINREIQSGPPCDPPPRRWYQVRNRKIQDLRAAKMRVQARMGVLGRSERAAKHAELMRGDKIRRERKHFLFIKAVEALLPEDVFRGLWDRVDAQVEKEGWR